MGEIVFTKDNTKIVKTEIVEKVTAYEYDGLVRRRNEYDRVKKENAAYYDMLIAEIDALIAEADKLSVVSAVAVERAANEAAEALIPKEQPEPTILSTLIIFDGG